MRLAYPSLVLSLALSGVLSAFVSRAWPQCNEKNVADTLLTIEEILQEERRAAMTFEYDQRSDVERLLDLNFIARLEAVLNSPESQPVLSLPLFSIANDSSFLKSAHVEFDEDKQLWSATWKKPRLFHFGMILKPSLEEKVKPGEELAFECEGMNLFLTKNEKNQLELIHNGERQAVDSKELRALLRRSISAEGLELFLDGQDNLVLEALGEIALSLGKKGG
jgi:hypothetical protein